MSALELITGLPIVRWGRGEGDEQTGVTGCLRMQDDRRRMVVKKQLPSNVEGVNTCERDAVNGRVCNVNYVVKGIGIA